MYFRYLFNQQFLPQLFQADLNFGEIFHSLWWSFWRQT